MSDWNIAHVYSVHFFDAVQIWQLPHPFTVRYRFPTKQILEKLIDRNGVSEYKSVLTHPND